jgi:hypothetical protein
MRFVFAIEGSVFILAVFALLVALMARIPWRWLRLTIFLLMAVLSPIPIVLIAHAGKFVTAKYPTLMTCGWGCVVAVIFGATVLPMVGLWRRGAARTPVARSWRIGRLSMFPGATLSVVVLTIVLRDVHVQRWIAEVRQENDLFIASVSPPPVPPHDDAAPALLDIYREMVAVERPYRELEAERKGLVVPSELHEWLGNVWEANLEAGQAEVLDFLDRHHERVSAVIAASKLPRASFHRPAATIFDDSDQDAMDLLRTLHKFVAFDALKEARDGNVQKCWEDLSCLERLQVLASSQGDIFWSLCGMSFESGRVAVVEAILSEPLLDAAKFPFPVMDRQFTHRAASVAPPCLNAAQMLEFACAWDLCELDDDPRILSKADQVLFRRAWPMRSVYALYRRVFVLADGLATLPSEMRRYRELATLAPFEQRPSEAAWWNNIHNPPTSEASDLAWGGAGAVYYAAINTDAKRRLAATGIAVAGFQARNHRDPNSLDELVPDYLSTIPIDPWNGRPLRMRHADGGIVLYSIGDDLVDDEGLGDRGETMSPDLPFHLGGAYPKHLIDMKQRREMMNSRRQ